MPQIVALGRHNAVELSLAPRPWVYATMREAEIEPHWLGARALNPAYFNGAVHMLTTGRKGGDTFRGELLASDFESFLHWRALGQPDRSVRAVGVACVLWSADGAIYSAPPPRARRMGPHLPVQGRARRARHRSRRRGRRRRGRPGRSSRRRLGAPRDRAGFVVDVVDRGRRLGQFLLRAARRFAGGRSPPPYPRAQCAHGEPELGDVAIVRAPEDLDRADVFDNTRQMVRRVLGAG